MLTIQKLLIANRGEIAVRIIQSAKKLGIRTVAIYSDIDKDTLAVSIADESIRIGPAPVNQSYLVIDKIIQVAKQVKADAIHPGYGFLSENAAFSDACNENNITFIGPKSEAIALMGNKRQAKISMLKAGVPCIPGYEGDDQSDECLISEARKIGFPVMIKAAAGGGGRGMRLSNNEEEFLAQLKSAKSEAKNAFGSDEMILEKAIQSPRHIEIQILADQHGNVLFLGERDCSVQRRHQKVIEEAPSPFIDKILRKKMGEAAVNAAKACEYINAGTVEFIVDENKDFYFLEMNTRLQVEHPVTEFITGIDLVEWQVRIAQGEKLPWNQDIIKLDGHAIEARLYAEDTRDNFMPQTGRIDQLSWPTLAGVRIDTGVKTHDEISPYYDPMLSKIIAHGANREQARNRLLKALEDIQLFGVTVNLRFLENILRHPAFIEGKATTAFIQTDFNKDESMQKQSADLLTFAFAATILHAIYTKQSAIDTRFIDWFSANPIEKPYLLHCNNNERWVTITTKITNKTETVINCKIADKDFEVILQKIDDDYCVFIEDGVSKKVFFHLNDKELVLNINHCEYKFIDNTYTPPMQKSLDGDGKIFAPMDGLIIDIQTVMDEKVIEGQTLVTLEAMKIEHPIKANCDGVIKAVHTITADQVKKRQLLIEIEPHR